MVRIPNQAIFFAVIAGACAATPFLALGQDERRLESEGRSSLSYDGRWTGNAKCLYDPGLPAGEECDVRLTLDIDGKVVSVHTVRTKNGKESVWDVKAGRLTFAQNLTNALLYSINTGRDSDGRWAETWSFAMTLRDADHMIVQWTRIVNNIDLPTDDKNKTFAFVRIGELVRLSGSK